MITSYLYKENEILIKMNPLKEELLSNIGKKEALMWVDIEISKKEELNILKEVFNLHPLAIEDCINPADYPKINQYSDYALIVLHSFKTNKIEELGITTSEIDIFLGKNFLITVHHDSIKGIEIIKKRQEKMKKGIDFLLYSIVNEIVNNYLPIVHEIDKKVTQFENEIFIPPTTKEKLSVAFLLRRENLFFHRLLLHQREIIYFLSQGHFPLIRKEVQIYFRDIFDTLNRIGELILDNQEVITSGLDIYNKLISNRLNEIMKVLTIIATIILPLTLLTSWYGMNFKYLPALSSKLGPIFISIIMLLIFFFMFIYFKKKKWF